MEVIKQSINKRCLLLLALPLSIWGVHPVEAQPIQEIVIGRHTYFDCGPPFDFYEILLLQQRDGELAVERIRLTPAGHICTQPGTFEVSTTKLRKSISEVLARKDPCAIAEKDLRRERKRCKKCPTFSGADVMMQFACSTGVRRIRIDILDRDLYEPKGNTPQHTSWTMGVLAQLDGALGDTVMEKPAFVDRQSSAGGAKPATIPSFNERALAEGVFDQLFTGAPHKPSVLYVDSKRPPIAPSVRLLEIPSAVSTKLEVPQYPTLARMAHVEGRVEVSLRVDVTGSSADIAIVGHPLLKVSVENQVARWRFPPQVVGQTLKFVMEFKTNCPEQPPRR